MVVDVAGVPPRQPSSPRWRGGLRAIRCGGFDMDAAIQAYVRHEHGVAIGERTGEELKLAIGSAAALRRRGKAEVPAARSTTASEDGGPHARGGARTPCEDQVDLIVDTVSRCLARRLPSWPRTSSSRASTWSAGGRCSGASHRLADETDGAGPPGRHTARVRGPGAGLCLDSFDSLRPILLRRPA